MLPGCCFRKFLFDKVISLHSSNINAVRIFRQFTILKMLLPVVTHIILFIYLFPQNAASIKIHEEMTEEELNLYFGTSSIQEIRLR